MGEKGDELRWKMKENNQNLIKFPNKTLHQFFSTFEILLCQSFLHMSSFIFMCTLTAFMQIQKQYLFPINQISLKHK